MPRHLRDEKADGHGKSETAQGTIPGTRNAAQLSVTDATVANVNQQTAPPGNARRRWRLISLFAIGVLAAGMVLWTPALRPSNSDRWMEAMRARGEVFTFEELGLDQPLLHPFGG